MDRAAGIEGLAGPLGPAAADFRAGRYARCLESVLGRARAPDLYALFFPEDDGRQDLVDWRTVRGRELKRRRPSVLRARAALRRTFPRPEGEAAALLAYCDLLLGRARAAEGMEEAARAAPPSFGLHFLRAVCLWHKALQERSRRLMPRALEAIERALAADPRSPYAYYVRACLRREFEDASGRLADVEALLRLRPGFAWARIEKAETLGETRRFPEALREYDALVRAYPRAAWAWAHRGRLLGLYGRRSRAVSDFSRAIRLDASCGPVYAWRGETWRRAGDYRKAFRDFDEAIRRDPAYRLAYLWRGRLHLLLGRLRPALRDLGRALRLEPREQLAAAWRAEALWKLGRCRDAALGFEAVHPFEPHRTWNRRLRSGETQELGYRDGGEGEARGREPLWRDLDEQVSARPKDAWAWAFRGRCRGSAGLLKEALFDLTRSLQLDARLGYAYRWRGECLRRLGSMERAMADLDKALELEPGDRWAAASRAQARAGADDAEGAEADYARALEGADHRFSVVHLWRSRWLHALGRRQEAERGALAAFRLDGKDPEILSWLKALGVRPHGFVSRVSS